MVPGRRRGHGGDDGEVGELLLMGLVLDPGGVRTRGALPSRSPARRPVSSMGPVTLLGLKCNALPKCVAPQRTHPQECDGLRVGPTTDVVLSQFRLGLKGYWQLASGLP